MCCHPRMHDACLSWLSCVHPPATYYSSDPALSYAAKMLHFHAAFFLGSKADCVRVTQNCPIFGRKESPQDYSVVVIFLWLLARESCGSGYVLCFGCQTTSSVKIIFRFCIYCIEVTCTWIGLFEFWSTTGQTRTLPERLICVQCLLSYTEQDRLVRQSRCQCRQDNNLDSLRVCSFPRV